LSEPFDITKLPFELVSTVPGNEGIRIDERYEVDSPDDVDIANYDTINKWMPEWLENARKNAALVEDDFSKRDANAHTFSKEVKDPTLVCILGSGSSLDTYAPRLAEFPGYVIGGPSNAPLAAAHGRPHDATLGIDSGAGTILYLKSGPFDEIGSTLITTPTIHPEVPRLFPKHRLWFNSIIQLGKSAQHPYNIMMKLLFNNISAWMYQAGCTVNAELLLAHMLEVMTGKRFRAVILLGTDMAYKKNASRCASYEYQGGTWRERDINISSKVIQTRARIYRARNGMVTDDAMIGYKRSLLTIWQISEMKLYDASDGILTEIPKINFSKCLDENFENLPEYNGGFIYDTYRQYLTDTGYQKGKTAGFEGTQISGDLWDPRL
jgi:hypothetical protein